MEVQMGAGYSLPTSRSRAKLVLMWLFAFVWESVLGGIGRNLVWCLTWGRIDLDEAPGMEQFACAIGLVLVGGISAGVIRLLEM